MSSTASRVQSLLEQRRKLAGALPVAKNASIVASTVGAVAVPGMTIPSTTGIFTAFITGLFYLSLVSFVLFLILTFIHFTIKPILPFVASDEKVPISLDKQMSWTEKPAESTQGATLEKPKTCDYTLSVDVFPTSKYVSQKAPRVFLYRSAQIVDLPKNASREQLLTYFPTTNIIAFIDAEKNDLYVGAVTSKSGQKQIEYAEPIQNVPVQKSFRLTLVVMPTFIEIYIDGKLRKTLVLKGQLVESLHTFWSSPTNVRETVLVGNLIYWPRPILSTDIRELAPLSPSDFFTKT